MPDDFYALARALTHEVGLPWHDPRTGKREDPPAIILRLAKEFPLGAPIGIDQTLYFVYGYKPDGKLIVSDERFDDKSHEIVDLFLLDIEALRAGRITMERVTYPEIP